MTTVLLVHSDVAVRSGWIQLLRGLGVAFRTAANFAGAAAVMAREPIGAIVADLGEDDPVEQLQWATAAICPPPMVLVSAAPLPSMASRASGVAVVPPAWPCAIRYALRTLLAARKSRTSLPLRTPPTGAMKWCTQLGADEAVDEDTWSGDHAVA